MEDTKELAAYKAESGNDITLTPSVVKKYICDNENVSDQEIMAFAALCKAHKLDPFIKEAYLIKYGTKPATMVVGKDVYEKRASRNPKYKGMQAGVFVVNRASGKGREREGSLVMENEDVIGAWAKVFVDGYDVPIYDSVSFHEYAGRRKDGSLNGQWAKMPGTMIRKVAIVHALREAFPEEFTGMYSAEEMEQASNPELTDVAPAVSPAEVIEDIYPKAQLAEISEEF